MPKKSRRTKVLQSKRREKSRQRFSATATQQQVVAQTGKSSVSPSLPASPVRAPAPTTKPSPAQYPYIVAELRRFGILSGIILVILIVLALVIS